MRHKSFCQGECDEGRECWRMNLLSAKDAKNKGVTLLTEEDIAKLLEEQGLSE